MLKTCSECGTQISDRAEVCPQCGYHATLPPQPVIIAGGLPRVGWGRRIIGGLVVVGCVLFIGGAFVLGGAQWDHIWYAIIAALLALIWASG